MEIKQVSGEIIKNSRNEETIKVLIRTKLGLFSASSPYGKSRGKHEKRPYKKTIREDIKKLSDLNLTDLEIDKFEDLKKIEKRVSLGANSLYSLESAILKALAGEEGKEIWEIINQKARKFPYPVGNCIGGGKHTDGKKPDFQEFLFIPKLNNFSDSVFLLKKIWEKCGKELEVRNVKGKLNDENAFSTSLSDEEILKLMVKIKEETEKEIGGNIEIGVDIAASSFYSGAYEYRNPIKIFEKEEQIEHILDLIDKYRLDYIEDPLDEEDFSGFSKLKMGAVKERPACIIVGDDLTVTQVDRFKDALKNKSINGIIIKPNQVGSLIELAKVVGLAKKNSIKTIFSHRSGETMEYVLSDLAFGFQADYIKTGVKGREREVKLNRLIQIEKDINGSQN